MTVAAYWCISDNFGDKLTPWLIEKIRHDRVTWVPHIFDAEHYIASGSILNWANKHAMVWGAGLASKNDNVNPEARLFAVRGPISRVIALSCGAKCPPIYGDPAILLPRFLSDPVTSKGDIALVPHYVDQYRVASKYPGHRTVNILDPIEKVVEEIRSSRAVVSSSLHGLIVAHAYGIPAAWVKWGDSIGGDGLKFQDYFMSVGLDVPYPVDRRDSCDEIPTDAFTLPDPKRMADMRAMLWNACPIRRS